jgi:hypothetical protein
MPKRNPYDIPVSELRFGASSDAWARRFAELTADDESIDADDRKPRVEVGTHSRAAEFSRDFKRRRDQFTVSQKTGSAARRESRNREPPLRHKAQRPPPGLTAGAHFSKPTFKDAL